ncbi:fumarylacetoacetate hydrolase family protein [Paraburkholderia sp. LEh10]|uniref:fumarylacetoacetate hydrolase family protein n=1 Tax=Paraburkholderia sp. LEh10 TaxID=2821353 RepID=UPI001AE5C3F2|nr:fumarylacetoacetate hydrolase family protein [Paraburkholderia sp. LEh10]MBP0590410.1 fumarylacetoacetate hydrolase family protein [Paraburkholderia sp. LEh10]
MKWCRIEIDGSPAFGILRNDVIAVVDRVPFDKFEYTGQIVPVTEATFMAPVQPQNFYAAGLNFRNHITWANEHFGKKFQVPTEADIGYRSPNALTGHGSDVIVPADSRGSLEFEGELVLVVGKRAKNLSEADAMSCIAGCTLGNDLSEREWQFNDRTFWRAKNTDTFKPMGPFVATGLDPMRQEVTVSVNGKEVSSYSTEHMIFSVSQYISRMSRYLTLHPGDVIWLGSDGPTMPGLKDGDVVEVSNPSIGTLRNRIVRAV